MPTWGEILLELSGSSGFAPDWDGVRRKYLRKMFEYTGRNVILYGSAWLQNKPNTPPSLTSITGEDIQGLMETVHNLDESCGLDLIMHSPGGELAATEPFVTYLRTKFSDIRFIVPGYAMSAASLIACSANTLLMGKHSFVGPIDPQFVMNTPMGQRMVAAHAIAQQFEQAKKECATPSNLAAWMPMLSQFGPDLLIKCKYAADLSKSLAEKWLTEYMFAEDAEGAAKAASAAAWLCNHEEMKQHDRYISRDLLRSHGLKVNDLEDDKDLQDAVLSIFHSMNHTFSGSPVVKIIENHEGKAFLKVSAANQGISPNFIIGPPPFMSGPIHDPNKSSTDHSELMDNDG